MFSVLGVPEQANPANGPPFNEHDFTRFADTMGFKQEKITPMRPKANGEVERFMRTVGKTVKAATGNGQPRKTLLSSFVRNYRSTPHPTTGVTPAELMIGRKMKTKLPEMTSPDDDYIRRKDAPQSKRWKCMLTSMPTLNMQHSKSVTGCSCSSLRCQSRHHHSVCAHTPSSKSKVPR